MEIQALVELAERLRGTHLRGQTEAAIARQLDTLLVPYVRWRLPATPNSAWIRGCICDSAEGFETLARCLYRPAAGTTWGRANYPDSPAYYASRNLVTVLGELRVEPGQFVQIVYACPIADSKLQFVIVGELEHVLHSGTSLVGSRESEAAVLRISRDWDNLNARYSQIFIDAFLAEQFSRRVDRSVEHKLTAAFARTAFNDLQAIAYPSVEIRGGVNIAIPPAIFDSSFCVVRTEVLRIQGFFGYGVYDYRILKASSQFGIDGTIDWSKRAPKNLIELALGHSGIPGIGIPWRVPNANRPTRAK